MVASMRASGPPTPTLAAAVRGGTRPSGGSTMSEVRFSKSRSTSQNWL